MHKKYSIGFFVGMICIILTLVIIYEFSYNKMQSKKEQESMEAENESLTGFFITEKDGYILVYRADKSTVFEYTSISTSELPTDMIKQIKKGISVETEKEVYGFLENYSS